jgi:hypothetical protein
LGFLHVCVTQKWFFSTLLDDDQVNKLYQNPAGIGTLRFTAYGGAAPLAGYETDRRAIYPLPPADSYHMNYGSWMVL